MRKLTTHPRTSLFLMEMIFSLLILAIACSAGIQIFAAARRNRQTARELNHIQELTSTVGEILEGCDGKPEAMLSLLPGGELQANTLNYYYDRKWNTCNPENAAYRMHIKLRSGNSEKNAGITFYNMSGEELRRQTIRFPELNTRGEAVP